MHIYQINSVFLSMQCQLHAPLAIAVRHTQSARGAAMLMRKAILEGNLEQVLLQPLVFPNGAPYRNVLSRRELAEQAATVAEEAVSAMPFKTLEDARDFLKVRLLAHGSRNAPETVRQSQFHCAEVAKDLGHMGTPFVLDCTKCPMETSAHIRFVL